MTTPDVRPVLLAYDGSAEAQAALREAVALFGQRPLIVASVWEPGLAMATMMPAAGEPNERGGLGVEVEAADERPRVGPDGGPHDVLVVQSEPPKELFCVHVALPAGRARGATPRGQPTVGTPRSRGIPRTG